MRLTFTVFGYEVWAIDLQKQDAAGVLADAIAGYAEEAEPEEQYTGGSGHNFERDLSPVSPDDRYAPWPDDRFGFR